MSYWQSNEIDWAEREPKGRLHHYALVLTTDLFAWLVVTSQSLSRIAYELLFPVERAHISSSGLILAHVLLFLVVIIFMAECSWQINTRAHRELQKKSKSSEADQSADGRYGSDYRDYFWLCFRFCAAGGVFVILAGCFLAWHTINIERMGFIVIAMGIGILVASPRQIRLRWQEKLIGARNQKDFGERLWGSPKSD